MQETIVCQTGEFIALSSRSLYLAMVDSQGDLPEGISFSAGVEDCWKGYRQNFASMADRRFCVVTFVHPETKQRVYHQLFGLPFGLGVVVNQFCRAPSLFTSVARRFMALLSAHYFDDNCLVDFLLTAGDAKSMFHRLAEMFGIVFSPSKALRMQSVQQFLGSQTDLTRVRTDNCVILDCKPSTKQKGISLIDAALESSTLTPAGASKLRGVVQWIDNWLLGRPCRGALSALIARQYYEDLPAHALSERLIDALNYLRKTMIVASGRVIQLRHAPQMPVVIYTDASAEGWDLRIGVLIFIPGLQAIATTADVPRTVIARWSSRSQYIGQAELLAAPLVAVHFGHLLQDTDVLWFFDNLSAMTSMLKAGSPTEDNSKMSMRAAFLLASLGCRTWFEHVPSAANPADPLSREALGDPWLCSHVASGAWVLDNRPINWDSVTMEMF
eukprot:5255664-Amphidinium_carterae.1